MHKQKAKECDHSLSDKIGGKYQLKNKPQSTLFSDSPDLCIKSHSKPHFSLFQHYFGTE